MTYGKEWTEPGEGFEGNGPLDRWRQNQELRGTGVTDKPTEAKYLSPELP